VCSFYGATAGSQSVATTAVSSAKIAVVNCGVVSMLVVYNSVPTTKPCCTPTLTEDNNVC
jgi:hypothetical protein